MKDALLKVMVSLQEIRAISPMESQAQLLAEKGIADLNGILDILAYSKEAESEIVERCDRAMSDLDSALMAQAEYNDLHSIQYNNIPEHLRNLPSIKPCVKEAQDESYFYTMGNKYKLSDR